jgi:alpha-L-fucosidase
VKFDAKAWVSVARAAGMRYITITSRHHDGFSMFRTTATPYNIVDWTPFHRDPLKELADECQRQGIKLFFYYSQLDWHHPDYWPRGETGRATGRPMSGEWNRYLDFMDRQLEELLTHYGPVGGIWFDGMWDKPDADWRLERTYSLIHRLQPAALIIPNHHKTPLPGEMCRRSSRTCRVPTRRASTRPRSATCRPRRPHDERLVGFNITDRKFKSVRELVSTLARAAGTGTNLLLNIGPRPDGTIDPEFVQRLQVMGKWLDANGRSIYETRAGPVPPRLWGVTTRRGDTVYVHVLSWADRQLALPALGARVRRAYLLDGGQSVAFAESDAGVTLTLPAPDPEAYDRVVVLVTNHAR